MQSIQLIRASDGTGNASVATVQTLRTSGATTIIVDTVQDIPAYFYGTMGTPHTFVDPITAETITVISEATAVDFKGHVDGTNLEIDAISPGYVDNGSAVGDIVVIRPTSDWANNIADVLDEVHNDDGSLKDKIIEADNISDAARKGWYDLGINVSSVTANGNRSYDVVFGSSVASTLSPGMRLRTTRTSAAPQNAFSLDGSNDYYSKTSPAGLSFTTTFTCSAWVYMTAYQAGYIINRRNVSTEGWSFLVNADGTVELMGLRIAANNKKIASYQSIPLNRWVHVAATMDMAVADTSAQKIWIDGVEVPRLYTLTGTATALVQGTTALAVGARSDGSSPFAGYIDQAAVFSTQLSDATIKGMISQGLIGSESGLVSAFSNGSTTDLNTTNANNLTAQNGATTVANSPFGNNGVSSTLDYAKVTEVAATTATVVVPSGCTIPTTGGVSAVAYSTQANPYGFPTQDKAEPIYVDGTMSANVTLTSNTTYYDCVTITIPGGMLESGKNYVIRAVGQLQANNNGVAASGDFLARIDIDGAATGTTSSFFTSGWFGVSLSPIGYRQIVATGADVSVILKGQRSGGGATNFVSSTYTRLSLEIEELTTWMASIGV